MLTSSCDTGFLSALDHLAPLRLCGFGGGGQAIEKSFRLNLRAPPLREKVLAMVSAIETKIPLFSTRNVTLTSSDQGTPNGYVSDMRPKSENSQNKAGENKTVKSGEVRPPNSEQMAPNAQNNEFDEHAKEILSDENTSNEEFVDSEISTENVTESKFGEIIELANGESSISQSDESFEQDSASEDISNSEFEFDLDQNTELSSVDDEIEVYGKDMNYDHPNSLLTAQEYIDSRYTKFIEERCVDVVNYGKTVLNNSEKIEVVKECCAQKLMNLNLI